MRPKARQASPVYTLDDLLEPYPEEVVAVLLDVREIILRISPDAWERAYRGWQIVKYDDTVYLSPKASGVQVGFLKGLHLPDPHGLLEGGAQEARRVWLAAGQNDLPEGLHELIEAAFVYDQCFRQDPQ